MIVDARGLSRPAGAAPDAGAIETGAAPLADDDVDGLPDLWEIFYGLNQGDPSDAFSDSDRDGHSALAEFHNHTNPNDPHSALRFVEVRFAPRPVLQPYPRILYLFWDFVPGVAYEIETSADLQQWRTLKGPFYLSATLDNRPAMLSEVEAESSMFFYRVKVKEDPFD